MNVLRSVLGLYSWRYAIALVQAYAQGSYEVGTYLRWYNSTTNFSVSVKKLTLQSIDEVLLAVTWLTQIAMMGLAAFITVAGVTDKLVGGMYFGAALFVAMPLAIAVLLPFLYVLARSIAVVITPKALGKALVCAVLEMQVRRLREAHPFELIAVAGTRDVPVTASAIAHTLQTSGRHVRYVQNAQTRLAVPLSLFGQETPAPYNVAGWVKVFIHNEWKIKQKYHYNAAVVELGLQGCASMRHFAYLRPEITVVTSIGEAYLTRFSTLDTLAREVLAVARYTHRLIVNCDTVALKYRESVPHISYGHDSESEYRITVRHVDITGQDITMKQGTRPVVASRVPIPGESGCYALSAAAVVADVLGTEPSAVAHALSTFQAPYGYMRIVPGIQHASLIDDSLNNSPDGVIAALAVLQKSKASQRIAILGSMPELGRMSAGLHRRVAAAIDSGTLHMLITIGQQAHDYIAVPARKRGVVVRSFMNSQAAGEYVRQELQSGAVVLCAGADSAIFPEEAIKPLLKNPKDSERLVRQSSAWMKKKRIILQSR